MGGLHGAEGGAQAAEGINIDKATVFQFMWEGELVLISFEEMTNVLALIQLAKSRPELRLAVVEVEPYNLNEAIGIAADDIGPMTGFRFLKVVKVEETK